MSVEYFSCSKKQEGCENSFHTLTELINHIQNDCLFFGSKYHPLLPSKIKNPISYPTVNISKYLMLNQQVNEEEQPDCFFFQPTQTQKNRMLKKSEKQISNGPQRFKIKDEIRVFDAEISKCILKSNVFCCFSVESLVDKEEKEKEEKVKKMTYFIAYPNEQFNLVVLDMEKKILPKVLTGHSDYINSVKYYKINKKDYLFTCSYDNTLRCWSCSAWEQKKNIINLSSWVNSFTILNDKFKTGENFSVAVGGFYPNFPIQVYSLSKHQVHSEIKVNDGYISMNIHHFHDETNQKTYIFNSVENEKNAFIQMYDFHHKAIIRTFHTERYSTKIELYNDSSNSLIIVYTDFKGNLRQCYAESGKVIKEVNLGKACFDFLVWDEDYFIVCGDNTDNSFKIVYKDSLQVVKTYANNHNGIIINIGVFLVGDEKFLVTYGADRKINIYKK